MKNQNRFRQIVYDLPIYIIMDLTLTGMFVWVGGRRGVGLGRKMIV